MNGISPTTGIRGTDVLSVRPEDASIRDAAEQFEAFLLEQLLQPITESPFGPTPFDGGAGGRLAREMLVSQLARSAAESGALGMASLLENAAGPGPPESITTKGARE